MPDAPIVTGVAPKEGPPGTKVTIRGENLGQSQNDVLGVAICQKNCSMTAEWKSSSKIICRTSVGVGEGSIIVITRSGGSGTCTVRFTGLPLPKVGPLQASPIWVDESEYIDQRLDQAQKPVSLSLRTDPLGLNSDDLGHKTQAYMQLAELFPKGSPDPTDENFVPSWFLVEKHRNTSFAKLKEGHAYMKKKANRNTNNAPLSHVKDSLPVFFQVHETLSGVYFKMQKNDMGTGAGTITDNLEATLNEASEKANHLFETVLSCKDRADSIRNTLNVLQRFKFLFNLPVSIDRNIQKGEYGVVINDYEKAKSLFSDTSVNVFKKVYDEVEKRITSFRGQLKQEVQQLPLPLARQKILIRYLIGLGDSGEPAWDCLTHQHNWIQETMLKCKDKHLGAVNRFVANKNDQACVKVMQDYLEELTHIVVSQIPEHWNLWQQYSTGVILSETGEKSSDVEKLKLSASRHAKQIKGLLRDTIILFVNLLRAAFLPATLHVENEDDASERESYGVWPTRYPLPATALSDCVRAIRESLRHLSQLGLPQDTLQSLKTVILDLRVLCLSTFLQETTEDVKSLKSKETWEVDNCGVTELPHQMNGLIIELVAVARDVLQSLPGEEQVFARILVQKSIHHLLTVLFLSCVVLFERTSFLEEKDSSDESCVQLPQFKKRLIVGMSNLAYLNRNYFENLLNYFEELQFPNVDQTKTILAKEVSNLDTKLFEAYLEHRVEPVTDALEPGMYAGSFDWNDCSKPTTVRPYIKIALMSVIAIHAEVYTICPSLVTRILTEVIRLIAEELNRLIHCITRISLNGSLQARLDVEAFRQATLTFSSPQSEKSFDEAMDNLEPISNNIQTTLDELIIRFKSNMIFQLRCFESL